MNTEFIDHDKEVGFDLIAAEEIDDIGVNGIVERVRERVGTGPVYLTSVTSVGRLRLTYKIAVWTSMYLTPRLPLPVSRNVRRFRLSTLIVPVAGTPEAGGFSVRELKRILRGLNGLNIVCELPSRIILIGSYLIIAAEWTLSKSLPYTM